MEFKKLIQDSEHKINADSFNLRKLNHLYNSKGFTKDGKSMGFDDAKCYMLRYLFPVEGGIVMNANGCLEFKSNDIMNRTYYGRIDKDLVKWFNSNTLDIYRRVCIPGRQLIKNNTINMVGAFKHINDMKYSECSEEAKDAVQLMLDFIKTVWCSGDDEQYNYIINWIANMIHGNKNQSLLYAKTHTEGVGKSTLTEFLMDYVIGRNLSIQPSSSVLTTGNNNCLFGKLFVCFEELKSSKSEWSKMSSCLKEWITSDTVAYSEKYMVGYTASNINNYIINTNTDAVKGANGRRYFICDLSTKYKGDTKYWNNLYNKCFNDETGKAFYLYMLNRDVSKFKSNVFPITNTKKESIADLMNPVHKFIKFNYLLCGKDINRESIKEFYKKYEVYVQRTECHLYNYRRFNALVKELNFDYKKSGSERYWTISLDELKQVANTRNWYSELDADEQEDHTIWDEYRTVKEMAVENNIFNDAKKYEDIIDDQAKQIEELKQQLLLLQQPKEKSKSKKKSKRKKKSKKKTKKVVKKETTPTIVLSEDNPALCAFLNMDNM